MTLNYYPEIGFDGVVVDGPEMEQEDGGEIFLVVPAMGRLHQVVAEALVTRPWPLAGGELRFLRAEMGEDQASFADTIGVALNALRAAEGDGPRLAPADEARIRHLAVERLELPVARKRVAMPDQPRPHDVPAIVVKATGERSYELSTAAEVQEAAPSSPGVPSPLDVARSAARGVRVLLDMLEGALPSAPSAAAGTRRDIAGTASQADAGMRMRALLSRVPAERFVVEGDESGAAEGAWHLEPVAFERGDPADPAKGGVIVFAWLGLREPVLPEVRVHGVGGDPEAVASYEVHSEKVEADPKASAGTAGTSDRWLLRASVPPLRRPGDKGDVPKLSISWEEGENPAGVIVVRSMTDWTAGK